MRPSLYFLGFILLCCALDVTLITLKSSQLTEDEAYAQRSVVKALGLTDICVATEARYTRHPAVSDALSPFMEHPGAMEHFPTGSFWTPPRSGPLNF